MQSSTSKQRVLLSILTHDYFTKLFERLQKHFSKSLKTETGFIAGAICQKNITLERRRFQRTKAY